MTTVPTPVSEVPQNATIQLEEGPLQDQYKCKGREKAKGYLVRRLSQGKMKEKHYLEGGTIVYVLRTQPRT